jgi:hypothetical protein
MQEAASTPTPDAQSPVPDQPPALEAPSDD